MLAKETYIERNNRVILVSICTRDKDVTINSLNELERLADTAGFVTVDKTYQNKAKHDSAYFLGKGFIQALKERMEEEDIGHLIFDDELTPSQHYHLEKDFEIKVIDRTELIINIFYQHAKTQESRLQIRLAELTYALPRLKQSRTDFDRIAGSSHGGGGASGAMRGGGEKQIDLDKFKIRREMENIQKRLTKILQQKTTQSKNRENIRRICLVGYTNAGKSTLFNRLTNSSVLVEDKLFATLDSTCRPIKELKDKGFVLTDTVGFIAKLPHDLVASFQATLKEAKEADLLLHIIDIADKDFEHQIAEVNTVLKDIGADHIPTLIVFNKIDQIPHDKILNLTNRYKNAEYISARNNLNINTLLTTLEKQFIIKMDFLLLLPYSEQKLLAKLYELGEVKQINHSEKGMEIIVNMNIEKRPQIAKYIV